VSRSPAPLRRALGWSVLVLGSAVAVSGVVEWVAYHPKATGAVGGFARVHHWSALLLAVVGAAWCFTTIVDGRRRGVTRRLAPALAFLVAALATFAAWVTGPLLAWDQVALWAVVVDPHVEGVWFGGLPAKFVIVDAHEYAVASFRQAAVVHVAVGILAGVALVGFALAWHAGRSGRARPSSAPTAPPG